MKKVAIFDIDGTVFRSSLLIELTDALVQEGIFNSKVTKLYAKTYENWLNRKGPYDDYIGAVVKAFHQNIKGVSYGEFSKVAKKVVAFHRPDLPLPPGHYKKFEKEKILSFGDFSFSQKNR